MEQFPRGGGPPSNPRAVACLVSRESELAFLLRSLIKRSPPPSSYSVLTGVFIVGSDDGRDVYYERGRKPKESIIKYEATRSEGDYRRKVLLARLCAIEGKDMV